HLDCPGLLRLHPEICFMTYFAIDSLKSTVRDLEAQLQACEHALEAADEALADSVEQNKELRKRIADAIVILEGGDSAREKAVRRALGVDNAAHARSEGEGCTVADGGAQ